MGFPDTAKRSYRTIHDWTKLSEYKECIVYCFENTPTALPDDRYIFVSHPVVNVTSYKNAGIWLERMTKRLLLRFSEVTEPLEALQFLYRSRSDTRIILENCIRSQSGKGKDYFPFHKLERIKTLSDERHSNIVENLMEDEKEERILAKEKLRHRQAKSIVDLEQKVQEQAAIIKQQEEALHQKDELLKEREKAINRLNVAYFKLLGGMSRMERKLRDLEGNSGSKDVKRYSVNEHSEDEDVNCDSAKGYSGDEDMNSDSAEDL